MTPGGADPTRQTGKENSTPTKKKKKKKKKRRLSVVLFSDADVKRPSHVKLMLANLSWRNSVGVCKGQTCWQTVSDK